MYKAVLFTLILACVIPAFSRTIAICDDEAEWPPYTFYIRKDGKPTKEISGYSVDIIKLILDEQKIKYTIKLLPWKRCQFLLSAGTVDILLNASYSEERDQKYYLSASHYQTMPYYFYSKKKHPKGLAVQKLADLKKYQAGGLLGYNYMIYGLEDHNIDLGAGNFDQIFKKLEFGRFDFFIEQLAIITGLKSIGKDYLKGDNIGYQLVPEMKPTYFHMLFTKNEEGLKLQKIVNSGLEKMKKDGTLDNLLKKYFSP